MEISAGQIIMWRTWVAIPDGWHECDGTNGTPDLRGKLVYGKTNDLETAEGGSLSHSHIPITSASASISHNHTAIKTISNSYSRTSGMVKRLAGTIEQTSAGVHTHSYNATLSTVVDAHTHTVGLASATSVPPNTSIIFIMRLS